jgi:tetratricopeptide (TPR) repeat protein
MQLESIYREQATEEAYQKLANLYLDRSQHRVDDMMHFLESRRQSARVFEEELNQPEGAFLVLLTAFTPETFEDEQLIADLGRLAGATGQWDELIGQFEEVLREIGDAPGAADVHKMVGRWQSEELGQPEEAVYHLQRALSIEPDNIDVMTELERLYREIAAWEELAQILTKRVEYSTDPDEQIEIWRKLGELYELQMGQVDDAVDSYRHILEIDPSDILAIESLERIYEAYDRWDDLIEILNQKADATYDPDEMVEIRFRIAQIWEERLDDIDNAVATYRDILAADQTHMPSLKELERIFMSHQRWEDLLGVYEQQLSLTHEPEQQVQIYSRQAALYEDAFEDVDRAIEAFNNMLMVEPEHLDAIQNLERLYRQHERWFDLVEALRRHADVTEEPDPQTATEVLNDLARVQRDQVNDPNAAIEAFTRSLHLNNEQAEVWSELATLFEDTANWANAIEAYQALIDLVADQDYQVDVYNQIGFLYDANLQDDHSAEQAYRSALELRPTHEPTLLALRDLYTRRENWQDAIRVLKQAEEGSRDLEKKADFLCAIGKIYEHELDDAVSALHYYESALENDPSNSEAAAPLIDLYVSEQRWERAAPLLDRLVDRGIGGTEEEQHRRYFQHARVSEELGRDETALESYRQAYELDPTHTDTLRGLSSLLYRNEEWEQAFKIFQALQFNHSDVLDVDELVDTYHKAGEVKERVGERQKAIQMFQKALEYDPTHAASLNALVNAFEDAGDWDQVVNYSQYLLDAAEEDAVRFTLHAKIGDIWSQKLDNPTNATRSYLEALDIDPTSVVILRKLLDIYTKSRQWSEAVEILGRLIEQEPDPKKQAKYHYTVAVIQRDEVGDTAAAVESFDAALDADVKMLKAFEAIDRIHTQEKSWKELERAYRRMLRRVTENDDGEMEKIKILLWQNLGEIYRSRLGHLQSAIGAFEAAVGLNPGDEKLRLILAELYQRSGEHPDGAIEQHKELIKIDPFRIESYRALWKAYMQKKQYDRAWCMAGALSFLQNANEQEEKFYRQYLGQNLKVAKGTFNQEMWKLIYHRDQDMLMSMILSVLAGGLRGWYSRKVKEWGVHRKKDLLSPDEQLMFCKIYSYSARTMGLMPAPRLYLKSDQPLGMRNANADPPAFVIGADMMQGKGDRELAFTIGKQLCWARPEHYLGSVGYPTEFLRMLFMATMHMTDPSLGMDKQLGQQGPNVLNEIGRMPGPMLLQMQKMMKQYLAQGKNPNLSAWLTAVDHTTSRMGLLLCGDLHQAAASIKNDTNPVGKATVKEKIRELVLFAISDEFFQLRAQLGLSIDSQ